MVVIYVVRFAKLKNFFANIILKKDQKNIITNFKDREHSSSQFWDLTLS
jgi:hypothetical protein